MVLKWLFRIVTGIFFAAAVCLVAFFSFWVWAMSGQIRGREISPDGFQIRDFTYHKPIFSQQGFWLDTWIDDDFSIQLATLKLVPIRAPSTWHLAGDNVTSIRSVDRHSEILLNLISTYDEADGFVWINWSKDHPEQAAKFWPIVQSMAFDRLYLTMPLLFLKAQEYQTLPPMEFEQTIRQAIVDDLQAMIEESDFQKNSEESAQRQALVDKYSPAAGAIPTPPGLNPMDAEFESPSSDQNLPEGDGSTVYDDLDKEAGS